jgi:Flp pilus assembly protein TadB
VARARLERLDALAAWTESLKDTIAGAVGLEEAIPATVPGAAPTIRPGLERLVERLRARQPLSAALRGLAEDLDDPSADLVIAALVLNAGLRGPGLATALEALAVCAREELALRQKVESGRRALRTGVRIIAGTTLGFVVALTLLDSTYLRPYDSLTGQLVLALVAGIFAAAFAWLSRLGRDTAPLRLLSATGSGGPR